MCEPVLGHDKVGDIFTALPFSNLSFGSHKVAAMMFLDVEAVHLNVLFCPVLSVEPAW